MLRQTGAGFEVTVPVCIKGAGAGDVQEHPDPEAVPASWTPVPAPCLASSSSGELLGAAARNLSGFG